MGQLVSIGGGNRFVVRMDEKLMSLWNLVETESIEAKVKEFPEESDAHRLTQTIPCGNPASREVEQHRRSPKGEVSRRNRVNRSECRNLPEESHSHQITQTIPGGNGASRETAT